MVRKGGKEKGGGCQRDSERERRETEELEKWYKSCQWCDKKKKLEKNT